MRGDCNGRYRKPGGRSWTPVTPLGSLFVIRRISLRPTMGAQSIFLAVLGSLPPADTTVLATDILLMVAEWLYRLLYGVQDATGSLGGVGGVHSTLVTIPGTSQDTRIPRTTPR